MIVTLLKGAVALVAFLAIMKGGLAVLRALARPNTPPPEGQLRRVNLRYRCSICAAEVKMVQAAEEMPAPPRHCQEEMELVAPPFE